MNTLEVLVMMHEEDITGVVVVCGAGFLHRAGHGRGSTAEHSKVSSLRVFLHQQSEKLNEIRTSKMSHRLEAGEQAAIGESLEVTLTNVQHGSSEVKLLFELSDEDVHGDNIAEILDLDLSDDISEPLKVALSSGHPQEVHLLAGQGSSRLRHVSDVLENGSEGGHSNSSSDENRHFKLVPILMSFSVWSIQKHLRKRSLHENARVVQLADVPGPRTHGSDVDAEVILVR